MAYSSESYGLISKGYNNSRKSVTANKKAGVKLPTKMTNEEMQEHIVLLAKAVMELTERVNEMEKGEMK